jgi:hypothetical protein
MKLTNAVVYFPVPGDVEYVNDNRKICTGHVCGFQVSGDLNLMVAFHGSTIFNSFQTVPHATSLADALDGGNKWMTVEEAELAGIDLSDPNQDIDALVNP